MPTLACFRLFVCLERHSLKANSFAANLMEVVLSCNAISLLFPAFLSAQPALARNTRSVQLKLEILSHFYAALYLSFSSDDDVDDCSCNFTLHHFPRIHFASFLFHSMLCWLNLQFPFAWSTFTEMKMIKQFRAFEPLLLDLVLFFHTPYVQQECTLFVSRDADTRTCATFRWKTTHKEIGRYGKWQH